MPLHSSAVLLFVLGMLNRRNKLLATYNDESAAGIKLCCFFLLASALSPVGLQHNRCCADTHQLAFPAEFLRRQRDRMQAYKLRVPRMVLWQLAAASAAPIWCGSRQAAMDRCCAQGWHRCVHGLISCATARAMTKDWS